jgi:CHAT domain-containing protein
MLGGEIAARFRSQLGEWAELTEDLVTARLAAADDGARSRIFEDGCRSHDRWRGRSLLVGLRARAPTVGEGAAGEPTLAVLRRELGTDGTLVEFADGRDDLVAYAVDAKSIRRFVLGRRAEITPLIDRFRAVIERGRDEDAGEVASRGAALHDLLLRPLLGDAAGPIRRLIVVPTNELALLPFDALVASRPLEPGRRDRLEELVFVVDRFEVSVVPSAAVLLELSSRPARRTGPALLIAAPLTTGPRPDVVAAVPSADPTTRSRGGGSDASNAAELPADLVQMRKDVFPFAESLVEAHAKEQVEGFHKFCEQASGSFTTPAFDLHVGGDASVAALRGDLKRFALLHFACHGYAPEDPRATGLLLAPTAESSGLLNVFDVSKLALDADVTVLAACKTAVGAPLGGEGLQSLSRAFLLAGSRSVVASLWDVEGKPTAQLMRSFYAVLERDRAVPISAALRMAKLRVKSGAAELPSGPKSIATEPAPPALWAGFVHYGR